MKNKAKNKFWKFIKNEAEDIGELQIYGYIANESWWGDEVTPKQFSKELKDLGDINILNIYINSGGGDVFASQAIYSILSRHKAIKNVYIDGLAASGASIIAMAGDKIIMPENAMMMIHNAWTFAFGEAKDFRKLADDLDKIQQSIVSVYKAKTGLDEQEIIDFLDAETWFTAEEAVEFGFADKMDEEKEIAACLKGGKLFYNGIEMNFEHYKNAPEIKKEKKVIKVYDEISLLEDKIKERKRKYFKEG